MANPDHESVVKQGAEAIRQWREAHPEEKLDLDGAQLQNTQLQGADLHRTNLVYADLHGAQLQGANLAEAQLQGADLAHANLDGANLHLARLHRARLHRARLQNTLLHRADLAYSDLQGADLQGADLHRADLHRTNLDSANLDSANLDSANLDSANLFEANLSRTNLQYVQKAPQAYWLETVVFISANVLNTEHSPLENSPNDALYFETCKRRWPERLLDWERLRVMGRLPLFGVSYTALILIPIVFYAFALYNAQVDLIRVWFEQVRIWTEQTPDLPVHITNLLKQLTPVVLAHLHILPIPRQSLLLVVSTILLAAGATLYTFFCPSRIKEFSRTQWCDQFNRSLLHYWPLAWKHRYIRLVCAVCYILGGTGALWVLGTKVVRVLLFILKNSSFSLL